MKRTVNVVTVIETTSVGILSLTAWPDNQEGNKLAEEHFISLVNEISDKPHNRSELGTMLEDGRYDRGECGVLLVHSS